jgi:SSS family solute:Na+ symporter
MAWLIDAGVLLAYFISVIGIGLYKGRGDKTMEGFAVGNRSIPWWAVLASILAAEISAATFLGAPDEGYVTRNYTYAQLAIGTVLARVVVAFVFIKPYYDFRVVSIYEFLRIRFGEQTKNGASAVFLITRALASGTRLYVAAIVLVLGYEMFSGVALAPLQQVWIYIGSLVFLTRGYQGGRLDGRHPGSGHVRFACICGLVAASRDPGRLARRHGLTERSQRHDFFRFRN